MMFMQVKPAEQNNINGSRWGVKPCLKPMIKLDGHMDLHTDFINQICKYVQYIVRLDYLAHGIKCLSVSYDRYKILYNTF